MAELQDLNSVVLHRGSDNEHWKCIKEEIRVNMTESRIFPGCGKAIVVLLTGMVLFSAGCAHIPKNPDKPVTYRTEPASEGVLVDMRRMVRSIML